jgi:hypothetical protein
MIAPIVLAVVGGAWWLFDSETRYDVGWPMLVTGFGVVVLGVSLLRDLYLKFRGTKSPKVLDGGSCTL